VEQILKSTYYETLAGNTKICLERRNMSWKNTYMEQENEVELLDQDYG